MPLRDLEKIHQNIFDYPFVFINPTPT